jgi:hypothetical protein
MAIIIKKNLKNAEIIKKSNFEDENYLQKLIYDNPESIPLYDIKEDIRLLVLCREFPTDSGPIDALGIDRDGNIYLVETKLYKNPDKRLVVAQVLDYGASLWKNHNLKDFIGQINFFLNKTLKTDLNKRIGEVFGLEDEDVSGVVENIGKNLEDGSFKFVVLMDKLSPRLKDLIIFLNQNSEFDIYAVELEYYKYESFEIMIPKIYGAEVKKDINVSSSNKQLWNWETFSKKLMEMEFGKDNVFVAKSIIDWSEKNNIEISWSKSQKGSFILGIYSEDKGFYPFSINGSGQIAWNAPHQGDFCPSPFNSIKKRGEILERIKNIKGVTVNMDKVDGYSGLDLPIHVLKDEKSRKKFFEILLWIKETLEK